MIRLLQFQLGARSPIVSRPLFVRAGPSPDVYHEHIMSTLAKQLLAAWKPPLSVPGHVSACISARVERCSAREICRGGVEKIEESMAKRRCRTTCSPAVQGPSLQVPLSENLRGALPDAVLTCRMGGRRIGDAACNIQKLTSVRASCKLTPSPLFCTLNTFVLHSDLTL